MATPLRLLILGDSEDDAELMARQFCRGGYDVIFERVQTPEGMRAALDKGGWQAIIADYDMPEFTGLEGLEILHERGPDIPFILVSSKVGEDIAVEAMKKGVHDFFMKNNLTRLVSAVERELRDARIRRGSAQERDILLRQALIYETIHEAVVITDTEGMVIGWNPAAERMFGYTQPEMLGKSPAVIYGAEYAPVIASRIATAAVLQGRWAGEIDVVAKDGTERVCEVVVVPLRGTRGDVSATVGVYRDITDRKRTEKELLARQRQLQALAARLSLAEERERRRVADQLHDSVAQNLAFAKMQLGALRPGLSSDDALGHLDKANESIDEAIRDTRGLIRELSPSLLYQIGLGEALEQLCEAHAERHGTSCECRNEAGTIDTEEGLRIALYQAAREMLTNTAKHARASKVTVLLQRRDGDIHLVVEDDGIGFDASEAPLIPDDSGGFGLFSIRERLSRMGGRLVIESEPGRGTRATLVVPLSGNHGPEGGR